MNYDFDQAKQAVAERHGYESWSEIWQDKGLAPDEYYEEVFRIGCNEAVKADRDRIIQLGYENITYGSIESYPLPFLSNEQEKQK